MAVNVNLRIRKQSVFKATTWFFFYINFLTTHHSIVVTVLILHGISIYFFLQIICSLQTPHWIHKLEKNIKNKHFRSVSVCVLKKFSCVIFAKKKTSHTCLFPQSWVFSLFSVCPCQVPLLIPCHRVISSSGQSGPYMSGKGDHLKQWLLTHERQWGEG